MKLLKTVNFNWKHLSKTSLLEYSVAKLTERRFLQKNWCSQIYSELDWSSFEHYELTKKGQLLENKLLQKLKVSKKNINTSCFPTYYYFYIFNKKIRIIWLIFEIEHWLKIKFWLFFGDLYANPIKKLFDFTKFFSLFCALLALQDCAPKLTSH